MGEAEGHVIEEDVEARNGEALQSEIRARRGDSCVLVAMRRIRGNFLVDPCAVLDALVSQLGFTALGEQWREINPEIAPSLGAAVIGQSLAFGHVLLPAEVASGFANRFLHLFPEPRRYFTNTGEGAWLPNYWVMSSGWMPITKRTFDTGLAVVTSNQVGILWAQEDD